MYLPGPWKILVTESIPSLVPGQGTWGTELTGQPFLLLLLPLPAQSTWPLVIKTDFPHFPKTVSGRQGSAFALSDSMPGPVLAARLLYVTSLNPHSNPLKHLFLSFILQVRLNYSARPFNYKLAEPEF